MAKKDPSRRKFLKHLSFIGIGGVIGMGVAEFSSPSEADIVDQYFAEEIDEGRKEIYDAVDEDLEPVERAAAMKSGGFPIVNEVVCAYHEDMQALSGIKSDPEGYYYIDDSIEDLTEKEKRLKGNGIYCTAPCTEVCPVDIVKLHLQYSRRTKFESYREGKAGYEPYDVKIVSGFPDQRYGKTPDHIPNKLNMAWTPYSSMPQPCIGCGKCFKICGYNAITWVNNRKVREKSDEEAAGQ